MLEVRDQWRGSNVDLYQLSEGVKEFFTDRQFEVNVEPRKGEGYVIEAKTASLLNVKLIIEVSIYGAPNDFTIEYVAGKKKKGYYSPSMIAGYLSTMLGGGILIRSEFKLQEALDKLEKAFWEHVDGQVARLSRSMT